MPKFNIAVARFPYLNSECPDVTDWLLRTAMAMKKDPRVGEIHMWRADNTPITMTRNHLLKRAVESGVDYLLMVDSDMKPDCEPDGKPFWETSWEFALKHPGPCVIGAPYCGPPPHCNIYVFRWANWMNDPQNFDGRLEQYAREEAAARGGIEEVAALPTGLILIDMRAIALLPKDKPPFYYEWADPWETRKASTEDVTFTRDLSMLGVPNYCNWDSWAGHHKRYLVGKPRSIFVDDIRESFRRAVEANHKRGEKLVMVGEGEAPLPPARVPGLDCDAADFQVQGSEAPIRVPAMPDEQPLDCENWLARPSRR